MFSIYAVKNVWINSIATCIKEEFEQKKQYYQNSFCFTSGIVVVLLLGILLLMLNIWTENYMREEAVL